MVNACTRNANGADYFLPGTVCRCTAGYETTLLVECFCTSDVSSTDRSILDFANSVISVRAFLEVPLLVSQITEGIFRNARIRNTTKQIQGHVMFSAWMLCSLFLGLEVLCRI